MKFMKHAAKVLLAFSVFVLAPLMVLAQVADPAMPIATEDALMAILNILKSGSFAGLAGAAAAVQVIMYVLRTTLVDKWIGKYKLSLIYLLSLLSGIVALKMAQPELSGWALWLHSTTLAAYQILFHQVYVQFIKKADEPAK